MIGWFLNICTGIGLIIVVVIAGLLIWEIWRNLRLATRLWVVICRVHRKPRTASLWLRCIKSQFKNTNSGWEVENVSLPGNFKDPIGRVYTGNPSDKQRHQYGYPTFTALNKE